MRLNSSFESFVLERSPALLRFAYLLTGDAGHAEDLLQTALLRTLSRWSQLRGEPEPYTRSILLNLSKDRIRSRRRRPLETPFPVELDGPAVGDPNVEDRRVVAEALASLPLRQRQVVVLRFFADLSVEETAEALNCSSGTVKSYTTRALSRLRELIVPVDGVDRPEPIEFTDRRDESRPIHRPAPVQTAPGNRQHRKDRGIA